MPAKWLPCSTSAPIGVPVIAKTSLALAMRARDEVPVAMCEPALHHPGLSVAGGFAVTSSTAITRSMAHV